jgi:hypothetical protein
VTIIAWGCIVAIVASGVALVYLWVTIDGE